MEIYELPVWYTITATAHHIIFPEGLLQPMSSHLYLWQFGRDLVWPHFDKSHLKLINMGDMLPPWLGLLRRDWDLHCHSTCIVQEEEEERKGQGSGEAERKASGRAGQRRTEGDWKSRGVATGRLVPQCAHPWSSQEHWAVWRAPARREGLMRHRGVNRSPGFMSHLLPLLKTLLNHNQIIVNCRFLLKQESPLA